MKSFIIVLEVLLMNRKNKREQKRRDQRAERKYEANAESRPKKQERHLLQKIVVILLVLGMIGMYVVLPIMSAGR